MTGENEMQIGINHMLVVWNKTHENIILNSCRDHLVEAQNHEIQTDGIISSLRQVAGGRADRVSLSIISSYLDSVGG